MLALYWQIVRFRALRFLAYPHEIWAGILRKLISIISLSLLWYLALKSSPVAQSFNQVLAYFLIAEGVEEIAMGKWGVAGHLLGQSIRQGTLSNFLMRPIAIFPYLYSYALGSNGLAILIGGVGIIAGIIIAPPLSALNFLLFLVFLPPAMMVGFAYNMFLGMIFFSLADGSGVKNAITHLVRILSGSWIPLVYFPEQARNLVLLLPFQVMVSGPTRALRTEDFAQSALAAIAIAYFWSMTLLVLIRLRWGRQIKKYEAVGL